MKKWVFVLLFLAASFLLGQVSGVVYNQYETFFSFNERLLNFFIQILLTLMFVVISSSLLVALVRPFWVIILSYVFSGIFFLLGFKITAETLIITAVYIILGLTYSSLAIRDLENRLEFSVRTLAEKYEVLTIGVVFLLTASFALGYRDDSIRGNFIIPPAYKTTIMELIISNTKSQLQSKKELQFLDQDLMMNEAKKSAETSINEFEKMLRPYSQFAPFVLGLLFFLTVKTIFSFITFVPQLILALIFFSLKELGAIKDVTETREVKKIILE